MASTRSSSVSTRPVSGGDRLWSSLVGNDVAFLLARANARSLALANAALGEYGLKARSYSVLALAAEDTRPTQRELSEFLRLDPSQIVSLVDELQGRGLVVREPDPNDRRANVVVGTDAGRELHRLARDAAQAAEIDSFGSLDAEDRERLTEMLRVLAADPTESDDS